MATKKVKGLGGVMIEPDQAGDSIVYPDENRTLFIENLNPLKKSTDILQLPSIQALFDYFLPNVEVLLKDEKGKMKKERIDFSNLADFELEKIASKIPTLKSLDEQKVVFEFLLQFLCSPQIQQIFEDDNKKSAFLDVLNSYIQMIDARYSEA